MIWSLKIISLFEKDQNYLLLMVINKTNGRNNSHPDLDVADNVHAGVLLKKTQTHLKKTGFKVVVSIQKPAEETNY